MLRRCHKTTLLSTDRTCTGQEVSSQSHRPFKGLRTTSCASGRRSIYVMHMDPCDRLQNEAVPSARVLFLSLRLRKGFERAVSDWNLIAEDLSHEYLEGRWHPPNGDSCGSSQTCFSQSQSPSCRDLCFSGKWAWMRLAQSDSEHSPATPAEASMEGTE